MRNNNTTGNNIYEPTIPIHTIPTNLSIQLLKRKIKLKLQLSCPSVDKTRSSRQAKGLFIMGTTQGNRMVHFTSDGTLLMWKDTYHKKHHKLLATKWNLSWNPPAWYVYPPQIQKHIHQKHSPRKYYTQNLHPPLPIYRNNTRNNWAQFPLYLTQKTTSRKIIRYSLTTR